MGTLQTYCGASGGSGKKGLTRWGIWSPTLNHMALFLLVSIPLNKGFCC